MVTERRSKTKRRAKLASTIEKINTSPDNHAGSNFHSFKNTKAFAQIIYEYFDSFQKSDDDMSPRSGKQKVRVTSRNKYSFDETMVRSCAIRLRDELNAVEVTSDLENEKLEDKEDEESSGKDLITLQKNLRQKTIIHTLEHIVNASLTCGVQIDPSCSPQKISNQSIKKIQEHYEYARDQTWTLLAMFLQVLEDEQIKKKITEKLVLLSQRISVEVIRGQCVVALGYLSFMNRTSQDSDCNIKMVIESLKLRLQDKSQAVRLLTVGACGLWCERHYQIVLNQYYPMVETLLHVMASDSSPAVRLAVLEGMKYLPTPDEKILSTVMYRVRDTKIKVRLGAISFLKTHANSVFQHLPLEDCVLLLKSGLNKRCSQTHDATSKMLCCGLLKVFKFNPLALLNHLEPTYNEGICEQVAQTIVDAAQNSKTILMELSDPEIQAYKEQVLDTKLFDNMWSVVDSTTTQNSVESNDINDSDVLQGIDTAKILYLCVRCRALQKMEGKSKTADVQLNKILPDVPSICNVLKVHLKILSDAIATNILDAQENEDDGSDEQDEASSTCLQLLRLVQLCDLKEEGSRRHLVSLLHSILLMSNTPDDILETCVMIIAASHDTEDQFIQAVAEVLTDINTSELDNEDRLTIDLEGSDKSKGDTITDLSKQVRSIAILSIVLENVSTRLSSNHTLKKIANTYIEPAVTHTNARVREAGVSCLGKYTILMMQDPSVFNENKVLLVEVAYNKKERMETRAQAILALTDLALINDAILSPIQLTSLSLNFLAENDGDGKTLSNRRKRTLRNRNSEDRKNSDESEENCKTTVCLVSILFVLMNGGNNPALRVVAAECCAKLMFSGKVHDANLVAELIVMYFDPDFVVTEEDTHCDDAKEVGSPVRLQQLLTLFFPAYSFRSKLGRDTLMDAIKPMLSIIYKRMQKRVRGKRAHVWPIIRMVEYVCNTVERGDDQAVEEEDSKHSEAGVPEILNSGHEDESRDHFSELSPVLSLSLSISEFLAENGSDLPLSFLRSLCKILHGVHLDLESEHIGYLKKLVKNMDDLSMIISDAVAIRSLENLYEVLGGINSCDEFSTDEINEEEHVSDHHFDVDAEDLERCSTDSITTRDQEGHIDKSNEDANKSENKENIDDEGDVSYDNFDDEKNKRLGMYSVDKENSIYVTLNDVLTPIKKKSRSSQSPLSIEPNFSPPKNKRKTFTPVKSATKPRATLRRRKELSDLN